MTFMKKLGEAGQWVTIGTDEGKPVRVLARKVPSHEERAIARRTLKGTKARASRNRQLADVLSDSQAETIERAIYEHLDSENWTVQISAADVELYSKELGEPVQAGQVLTLDHRWTEALKRDVYESEPRAAARLDNAVAKLTLAENKEEEEQAQDF